MIRRIVDCILDHEIKSAQELVIREGLRIDDKVTQTIAIYDDQKIVATGSLYHNVIKMIAVDQSYQGENLTALILSRLTQILSEQNINKYFLFTTSVNQKFFLDFNFQLVLSYQDIVMLENKTYPIRERLMQVKRELNLSKGITSGIVMNCNPITNGHLYLIETCAKRSDHVIIFLVEEDQSVFPFDIRLNLVRKATKHLKNVHVVPSTPYIISAATFPTYFLKELSDFSNLYMNLDLLIFKTYFMDILEIDFRYVGNEPLDPMTSAYNQTMKSLLNEQLVIIDRLTKDQQVISASLVRKLVKDNNFEKIKNLVPSVTYQFLKSKQGRALFK
jgi:[citrate (pro-3S)-lyase] ligase